KLMKYWVMVMLLLELEQSIVKQKKPKKFLPQEFLLLLDINPIPIFLKIILTYIQTVILKMYLELLKPMLKVFLFQVTQLTMCTDKPLQQQEQGVWQHWMQKDIWLQKVYIDKLNINYSSNLTSF